MANAALAYTVNGYDDREKKRRFEKIGGKIVMMAAMPAVNHNRVVTNLTRIFSAYLRRKRCEAFSDGVEIHFDEENTFVPDAMIVCNKDIIKQNGIYGAPDLVVEVLSYSTEKYDRGVKKDIYEKYGVKEYWLVDYRQKTVEVWQLRDGRLMIDDIYRIFPDDEWAMMEEEDKKKASLHLKVSLYDDLIVDVREIFERI